MNSPYEIEDQPFRFTKLRTDAEFGVYPETVEIYPFDIHEGPDGGTVYVSFNQLKELLERAGYLQLKGDQRVEVVQDAA